MKSRPLSLSSFTVISNDSSFAPALFELSLISLFCLFSQLVADILSTWFCAVIHSSFPKYEHWLFLARLRNAFSKKVFIRGYTLYHRTREPSMSYQTIIARRVRLEIFFLIVLILLDSSHPSLLLLHWLPLLSYTLPHALSIQTQKGQWREAYGAQREQIWGPWT